MPIPLRLREAPVRPAVQDGPWYHHGYHLEPGDCWYLVPDGDAWCLLAGDATTGPLMPMHIPDVHRRPGVRPMAVVLPGEGGIHCLHTSPSSRPDDGWTVTGELPNVTVSPSIDVRGRWHGWIRDGMLVDC